MIRITRMWAIAGAVVVALAAAWPAGVAEAATAGAASSTVPLISVTTFDVVVRPWCYDYRNVIVTVSTGVGEPDGNEPTPNRAYVQVLKDGVLVSSATLPSNPSPATVFMPNTLCGATQPPGVYTVIARLEYCGLNGVYYCEAFSSATFSFRRAGRVTISGPKAALAGHVMTLSGRIDQLVGSTWYPAFTRGVVYFRQYSTQPWSRVASIATSRTGDYTLPYVARVSGCYRAVFPGSTTVAPANATTCIPVV